MSKFYVILRFLFAKKYFIVLVDKKDAIRIYKNWPEPSNQQTVQTQNFKMTCNLN